MRKLAAVLAVVGLGGGVAMADHSEDKPADKPADKAAGESEQLYSCKQNVKAVAITFKPDMELKELVTWVMGFTCKTFIWDPRTVSQQKKITIIAPEKMSPYEAYRVFLAALATAGLTVVPVDDALKIVDASMVKKESVPIAKKASFDSTDEVVRYVYKPKNAAVAQLQQAFAALKSDPGDVVVIGNLLLITDYSAHVRDMMQVAATIDVEGATDGIYTISVKHADATKLSDKLEAIMGVSATSAAKPAPVAAKDAPVSTTPVASSAVPTKMIVDERTNTLVLVGSPAAFERTKSLVERLDIELDIEGGQAIHVFQLKSAIAEDVAQTLTQAVGGASADTGKASKAGGGGAAASPAAISPAPVVTGGSMDGLGASLEGKVRILGDKHSNKLIVISSGRDYLAMRDVIRELDVPRRQVYIEAIILEVDLDHSTALGVASHTTLPYTGGRFGIAGVQTKDLSSTSLSSLAAASGLVGGLVGPLLNSTSLLGQNIPSYAVLANAMAANTNTNILSTPSVIALDNDEAKFKVGQNIPYKRGTLAASNFTGATTAAAAAVSTNIDRQDLTLEFDIKPHITDDDSVMLEVKNDSKDLGADVADLGPSWTTRSFETKMVVHDQQTIILGGMMEEREKRVQTKVPILGDIPVLGHLFSYTTTEKQKKNLLIMLTPYIIKDRLDMEKIRARKVREYDEFVTSFHTLEHSNFDPKVDYDKKRGLMEEINREVQLVDQDAETLKRMPVHNTVHTGIVTPGDPSDGSLDQSASPSK